MHLVAVLLHVVAVVMIAPFIELVPSRAFIVLQ